MHLKLSIQIIVISCAIMFVGCQANSNSDDEIKGIPTGSLSDFVQNPVSASGTDTINVARMDFSEPVFDFGTVDEGDVVKHEFSFTNTGKLPLIISTANSTCGCTVPEWPKEPIESGETASVMVRFNTLGKPNKQTKPVSIFANTYPNETKVYLKGYVKPKQE